MAHVPNNEFTQMIDRVSRHNAGGVGRVESPVIDAGDLPLVRSAAVGQAPLTPEERAELDAKAAALGIAPGPEGEEAAGFPSREEAERLAAPVTSDPLPALEGRQTAREFLGRAGRHIPVTHESFPRLPDFSKPGIIDTIRGVIYLDGIEFPIPPGELAEFRAYIVTTVHAHLTAQLNAALAQVLPPPPAAPETKETTDGGAPAGEEAVQPVQEAEASGGVQPQEQE